MLLAEAREHGHLSDSRRLKRRTTRKIRTNLRTCQLNQLFLGDTINPFDTWSLDAKAASKTVTMMRYI